MGTSFTEIDFQLLCNTASAGSKDFSSSYEKTGKPSSEDVAFTRYDNRQRVFWFLMRVIISELIFAIALIFLRRTETASLRSISMGTRNKSERKSHPCDTCHPICGKGPERLASSERACGQWR